MTSKQETAYAAFLMRLLLDSASDRAMAEDVDWDLMLRIAERNVVLVRSGQALHKIGVQPARFFADAVNEERQRIRTTIELIRRIGAVCSENGIAFIFAKAFQHYPDMGHDVDLLVLSRSREVDGLIGEELHASPLKRGFSEWISGTSGYDVEGCRSPLEIHHGLMGNLGQHHTYPAILISNRRRVLIEGTEFYVPSPEDQLIVQGMQRVYGRRYIRLSDVFYTISSIREDRLNWDYIIRSARQTGIFHGLCCYLDYVGQIHEGLFECHLFSRELRKGLVPDEWGRVEFRDGYYRFPTSRVAARIYTTAFLAELVSRNWEGVGRLCLLPVVAMAAAWRPARPRIRVGAAELSHAGASKRQE